MDFDDDLTVKPGETGFQWARRTGNYSIIRICECCMFIEANGDPCGDDDCDTCKPGGLYELAYANHPNATVTLGAFTECGHDLGSPGEDEGHADNCDRHGFTQRPCDLCGSPYHGDRYAAVMWPRVVPEPLETDRYGVTNLFTYVKEGE